MFDISASLSGVFFLVLSFKQKLSTESVESYFPLSFAFISLELSYGLFIFPY